MTAPRGAEPGGSGRLPWMGAGLGVLWYVLNGGLAALDPGNLDWLGDGDLAQHVLGWLLFRDAPWGLPLGRTPNFMTPLTMTVGFSDSNPWVAVVLKLFSAWLPRDFQFIGPWFALCFALQGWMGVKLMGCVTSHPVQRLLGAALLVMSPVLLFRTMHDTLCAQWMLLALLHLNLRPRGNARSARAALGWAAALNVLAAGVHPYLEVMVFALTLSLLGATVREQHLGRRAAGAVLASLGVGVLGLFLLFGYVGQGVSSSAVGFGYYNADVLTLLNPMGWSRVLPEIPLGQGQYEGFGYLGTGGLVLAGVTLAWRPSAWWPDVKTQVRHHRSLALGLLWMTLLALSSVLTVAGRTVISVRGLTSPLLPLLAPFRASGRFIWPLHYTVMTGLVALAVWRWRRRPAVATLLLLGAGVLQALDSPGLSSPFFQGAPWPRLPAPQWERVDPFYRHIVLYPPFIRDATSPCVRNTFAERAYVHFGDLAYRKHLTTNSGYSARINETQVEQACRALKADVEGGRLARDTLYVVDAPQRELFTRLGAGITCGELDGFLVCVAAKEGGFREALLHANAAPGPG